MTVVRLKKALYRLRQASKLWFDEINGFLLALGIVASPADPNLYRKGSVILLLFYNITKCKLPKSSHMTKYQEKVAQESSHDQVPRKNPQKYNAATD